MRLPSSSATKRSAPQNAASLRTQGLIQPITVRPNSDGYEIIAGARRFRAAQLAAFEEIPVRIVQLSDEQALEWMLVENSEGLAAAYA
jgi:ParB family chromosome partitioning protein